MHFSVLAVWYLLFQHHITFKTFEDVLWQDSPHFAASRLFGNATIKSDDPSVFSSRIVEQAVFTNYDTDKDGKLGHDEFQLFLSDLAKSRMLPQLAGKEGPVHDEDGDSKKPAAVVVAAKETEGTPSSPPPLSPSPPPLASHCPELSKELIASFARDKTIMLTVCDWRIFETFGINWMKHLRELKVDYFIVGATDSSTSLFLSSGDGKHPCFKFFEEGAEAMMKKDYKYGDDHYRAATWRKVTVVEKIVDWGFNVLHSDVDVVWFRDPLPYFLGPALAAVDVATSTDLITSSNPVGDEGLELAIFQHCNVNTGVYFVKSSEGGKFFMAQWADLRERLKGDNDQTGLYQWLRGNKADIDHAQRRLVYQLGPKPSVALISVGMLLNGYSYFIPRLHERKKVKPLGIHMTWLPLSKEGKFHRMRDGMLYHEKPEYFNDPLFITADLDFPSSPPDYNTWMDTEAMVQFHLKAMDKQLIQVYRVMAIALILNRTLIFPKMQCFCYKNWFMSEQCKIPGDKNTIFPIECHLDQWLRPKVLYNYGAKIVGSDGVPRAFDFREHSALENPRRVLGLVALQAYLHLHRDGTFSLLYILFIQVPQDIKQVVCQCCAGGWPSCFQLGG